MVNIMKKRGQIWVETMLYTVIGLALIGIVLAIVTPKINESKDRLAVEQAIESLGAFENRINTVLDFGGGNQRAILEFTMKRGELFIDVVDDKISFVIDDLNKPYSEPGQTLTRGRIEILSEKKQKTSNVSLTLDYSGIANLTYNDDNTILKKFSSASTPYSFRIRNLGRSDPSDFSELDRVNIVETS